MIDRRQEADILRSLAEAYQEIVEGKGKAKGNVGGGDRDGLADGRNAVAAGGNAFGGGVTPWRGLGRQYTGDKSKAKREFDQHHKDGAKQRAQDRRGQEKNKLEAGGDPNNKAQAQKPKSDKKFKALDTPAGRNRAATKELRRMGWRGYDDDTPEKPHKKRK